MRTGSRCLRLGEEKLLQSNQQIRALAAAYLLRRNPNEGISRCNCTRPEPECRDARSGNQPLKRKLQPQEKTSPLTRSSWPAY